MPFQLTFGSDLSRQHTSSDDGHAVNVSIGSVGWAKARAEPFFAVYNTRDGGHSGYCFIGDPSLVGNEGNITYDWLREDSSREELELFLEKNMKMAYDRLHACATKPVDKKTVAALAFKLQQERDTYQQRQERWGSLDSVPTQDVIQANTGPALVPEYQG